MANTNVRISKMGFEIEDCSRCGGSGHYSYCQRYGTRCFKCGGKRWTYTKRGQAARSYYEELCTINGLDLKIGDIVAYTDVTFGGDVYGNTATVNAIKNGDILTDKVTFSNALSSKFRLILSGETKQQKLEQAVEYQRTLTKQGKLRKS